MSYTGESQTTDGHLVGSPGSTPRFKGEILKPYAFGSASLSNTAVARFLFPGNGGTAPTSIRNLPVGQAGRIRGFSVFVDGPSGSAVNVTYELFVNGAASGMLITGLATATSFVAAGNVLVSATDRIALRNVKSAAIGVSITNVAAVVLLGEA